MHWRSHFPQAQIVTYWFKYFPNVLMAVPGIAVINLLLLGFVSFLVGGVLMAIKQS